MSKLEKEIIIALIITVIVPLLVSIWLVGNAVESAISIGVNPQIENILNNSSKAYKELFMIWKDYFKLQSNYLAELYKTKGEEALLKALKTNNKYLDKIELTTKSDNPPLVLYQKPVLNKINFRETIQTVSYDNTTIRFIYKIPWDWFHNFDTLGENVKTYRTLRYGTHFLKIRYTVVYLILNIGVILVSLLLGTLHTRKITKRLLHLSKATQQIAKGNLNIKLKQEGNDEIGDLFKSFNDMVKKLKESKDKIEYLQKLSAWQDIARKLAHEIKNPLTPIKLSIQELKSQYKGEDQQFKELLEQVVTIVNEEVETLRRLISDFSLIAKLPEVHLEKIKLGEFLDEIKTLSFYNIPPNISLKLLSHEKDKEIMVKLDRILFRRAIENILQNAIEAIGKEKEGWIKIETAYTPGWLYITIENNGPKIPSHIKDKIFDPYFTTKPEGTGVGLAIVKKIVLDHNGVIDVVSEDTTKFIIKLPLYEEEVSKYGMES